MSNLQTCERGIEDIDSFISKISQESADIVAQEIPTEYRSAYLSTYAAALVLDKAIQGGVYV